MIAPPPPLPLVPSSAPLCTLQSLQCTPCPPGAVADDDDDDEDYDELSLIVAALRRHFLSIIAHSHSTVGAQCVFCMQNYSERGRERQR